MVSFRHFFVTLMRQCYPLLLLALFLMTINKVIRFQLADVDITVIYQPKALQEYRQMPNLNLKSESANLIPLPFRKRHQSALFIKFTKSQQKSLHYCH